MTSDAATIIRELEVVHPAAKLVVMASQAQESEVSCLRFRLWEARFFMGGFLDGRCDEHGPHFRRRAVEESGAFVDYGPPSE